MSKICSVTGKRPMTKNLVSHSNRKTKTVAEPNLQTKRIWNDATGRFVKIRLSARGLRTLEHRGVGRTLEEMRRRGAI